MKRTSRGQEKNLLPAMPFGPIPWEPLPKDPCQPRFLEMVSIEPHPSSSSILTSTGFEQFALHIEGLYRWYLNIDRSYDKLRFAKFWDVLSRYPFFEDIADYWELEVLAIHPAFQRQGLGSILLTWGMNQASLYQLPVVVAATINGEHLYRKHGFKECSRIHLEDSGFGWAAMVWRPPAKV